MSKARKGLRHRSCGHGSAFFRLSKFQQQGRAVRSVGCTRNSYLGMSASKIHLAACVRIPARHRIVFRVSAACIVAATLAACAQSPVATSKSNLRGASRQTSTEGTPNTPTVTSRRATEKHSAPGDAANKQRANGGVASFYQFDTQTASGDKFDPNKMTAAHPTLPFGTRLRVTNAATGRSVTVLINDRGPYVPGRVIDLSYSAAEKLGIVEQGIAKVKLDVVH
jgi:rare lipoprotein A